MWIGVAFVGEELVITPTIMSSVEPRMVVMF